MKGYTILLAALTVFTACASRKTAQPDLHPLVHARYSAYEVATGNGRGIIFRLSIVQKPGQAKANVSALFIGGREQKFSVLTTDSGTEVEADYFRNVADASNDPVITDNRFDPSWIILNSNGRQEKIPIVKFTDQNTH